MDRLILYEQNNFLRELGTELLPKRILKPMPCDRALAVRCPRDQQRLCSGLLGGAVKTMRSKFKVVLMHLQNGEKGNID